MVAMFFSYNHNEDTVPARQLPGNLNNHLPGSSANQPLFFQKSTALIFIKPYGPTSLSQRKVQTFIAWMSPPLGFVKLNVDAAARTNPGDLAAGGSFHNDNGKWSFGFTCRAGYGHIPKAEIVVIFNGLKLAWERGFRKVIVESDSLLVVN
ncbi:putative ribonuclease H protein [Nymphaea thermarum]|nr:putative ribonuclease H protein [Nymphaea thermarum]